MTGIEDRLKLRITVIALVVLSMFGVLIARLWFLQVLAGDEFAAASERNSVRIVSVEAPRGRILDRKGRVIVGNRTALAVGIRKDDLPKDAAEVLRVKRRVARMLHITVAEINRKLADVRTSPFKPVVIADDVPEDVIFAIRERQYTEFPGVETLSLPVRTYPYGNVAAHIVGYVGETNEEELTSLKGEYRLGDSIGRTGIERTYEKYLRGRPGLDKLEVDATGRVLRVLGGQQAQPGNDVMLSIDIKAQKVAEQALREGMQRARSTTFAETGAHFRAPAGAIVVLDPRTGGVIAMASAPTFAPKKFVGGVSTSYWERLNDPANHNPLLNRAVQAAYPPGSTFKPILATAALSRGDAGPGSTYLCSSQFRWGDTVFRNWRAANSYITLEQSLVESCDTVYYQLAQRWWLGEQNELSKDKPVDEVMQDWAGRFGLGTPTGIDLPQESSGTIPGRAWKQHIYDLNKAEYCARARETGDPLFQDLCERGYLWRGGDAVNMSIGQGDVEATPLQMAVAYGAIANGGTVWQPHLAAKIVDPDGKVVKRIQPKVRQKLRASPDALRYVQNSLGAVVSRGTAAFPYRGWPLDRIPMGAKTGSAEIAGRQPFSWFASYGPLRKPRYVAAAVVEEAGFGSQVAGPVVRRVMDELFHRKPLPIVFGTRSD